MELFLIILGKLIIINKWEVVIVIAVSHKEWVKTFSLKRIRVCSIKTIWYQWVSLINTTNSTGSSAILCTALKHRFCSWNLISFSLSIKCNWKLGIWMDSKKRRMRGLMLILYLWTCFLSFSKIVRSGPPIFQTLKTHLGVWWKTILSFWQVNMCA